jgi:hypothetical protein
MGFRNKKDEFGVVTRNKARLVGKGHTQVEGLNFGETYAPVARVELIHILLAHTTHNGFKLHQMINALRIFVSRTVLKYAKTILLSLQGNGKDIFVCQIYVDDIIFGSTNDKFREELVGS